MNEVWGIEKNYLLSFDNKSSDLNEQEMGTFSLSIYFMSLCISLSFFFLLSSFTDCAQKIRFLFLSEWCDHRLLRFCLCAVKMLMMMMVVSCADQSVHASRFDVAAASTCIHYARSAFTFWGK